MYRSANDILRQCHAERMSRLKTRRKEVEVEGITVIVCERVGEHIGTMMWPEGSMAMMKAIAAWETWAPGLGLEQPKTIVELGSGCGVCGLYAQKVFPGTNVIFTDLPAQLSLLRENVAANECKGEIRAYQWGDEFIRGTNTKDGSTWKHPDLVLASECVYDPMLVEKFLLSLHNLGAPALLSFGQKREAEKTFWESFDAMKNDKNVPVQVRQVAEKVMLLDFCPTPRERDSMVSL